MLMVATFISLHVSVPGACCWAGWLSGIGHRDAPMERTVISAVTFPAMTRQNVKRLIQHHKLGS